jgi:hypothetical protein
MASLYVCKGTTEVMAVWSVRAEFEKTRNNALQILPLRFGEDREVAVGLMNEPRIRVRFQ